MKKILVSVAILTTIISGVCLAATSDCAWVHYKGSPGKTTLVGVCCAPDGPGSQGVWVPANSGLKKDDCGTTVANKSCIGDATPAHNCRTLGSFNIEYQK